MIFYYFFFIYITTIFSTLSSVGMAASPGGPINDTPPALNSNLFSQNLGTSPKMGVCRLCAKEDLNCIEIYSDAGKSKELPEKVKLCLPVLVSHRHVFLYLLRRPVCFA